MNRRQFLTWTAGLAPWALTGCGAPNAHTLLIGMEAAYPPFEMLDAKGQCTGVSADLGTTLATHLGTQATFKNIPFDGLVMALKSGSIDLVISSMTATDEKRKSIDFSDPYVRIGLALLVNKNSPVQSSDDLKTAGRRVAVRLGTTGEAYARRELPQAKVVALDSDTACVLEVVNGGVDAWIYDQLSVMKYHAQHPDATRALLKPLQEEHWAIGIRQGRPELKSSINAFLSQFRESGGFTQLADKYLAEQKAAMQAQGIPFVFDV